MPVCHRLHMHRKRAYKFHANESIYYIDLMQAILYQFKGAVAAWKRLECPQRVQGTW